MWRRRTERLLILGNSDVASRLIEELRSIDPPRHVIVGMAGERPPAADSPAADVPWLGSCARLAEIAAEVRCDRILVAVADRRKHLPLQSLLECRVRGVVIEDANDFYERLTGKIAIESLRPSTLFLSDGFRYNRTFEIVARACSIAVALGGLALLAPLLALIALAVRLNSDGPVFFIQPRAGKDGKAFGLVKFRTMHGDSDGRSEWVRDNEDRITRVGRLLRRFRLDELPQLVNVVRGEMNLIGPRPHPVSNHAVFMDRIAYYRLRSAVHPGVTGWAQVRYGYANGLDEETEKMRYDLYYIKNRSLRLDARIMLQTARMVLTGRDPEHGRMPERPSRKPDPRHTGDLALLPWLRRSAHARQSGSER
jgi:exopolysaccharide biosynthesis polyprenyl glycosylphosphotransferase